MSRILRIAALLTISLLTAAQSCSPQATAPATSPPTATASPQRAALCAGNLSFVSDWLRQDSARLAARAREIGVTEAQLASQAQQLGAAAQTYARWLRGRVGTAQADQAIRDRLLRLNAAGRSDGFPQTLNAIAPETDRCVSEIARYS